MGLANILKSYADEVYTDVIGNVVAHKVGDGESIMLIAHHDVVCLMITYIDANGFLYVKPSGGIDASILPARNFFTTLLRLTSSSTIRRLIFFLMQKRKRLSPHH